MDIERWQRLSPLLDALLELPADQREEHLRTLRDEDPALAAELERLLTLDAGDASFLDTPAMALPSGVMAGARLGPYRLERLLGEGGMGQVWLAERADGMYERKVALKLLRPGLANPQLRQRFDREREILARFAHPHIARLLDAGVAEHGQPWLALDHVQDIMNRDILTVDLRSDHRPTLRLTPNALAELRRAQGIETVENEL